MLNTISKVQNQIIYLVAHTICAEKGHIYCCPEIMNTNHSGVDCKYTVCTNSQKTAKNIVLSV